MITIAYTTARKEPMINWFFDSLHQEVGGDYSNIKIVIIDFYAEQPGRKESFLAMSHCPIVHITPKPTVWQGPHRTTKIDYWAKCNTLNTALCHVPDGWVTFVDDLCVIAPGWMSHLDEATTYPIRITLGSFKKLKKMKVFGGVIESYEEYPPGVDSRWKHGEPGKSVVASGSWMYGHVTGHIDAFLSANGYPELLCDSLSAEDYLMGMRMQSNGYSFRYNRDMVIYESEELHHVYGGVGKRFDKGTSPNDKSHAALEKVRNEDYDIWNSFDLAKLRESIQNGADFPPAHKVLTDWFDGQPLSEL